MARNTSAVAAGERVVCHYLVHPMLTACGRSPYGRSTAQVASRRLADVNCLRCLANPRVPQGPRQPQGGAR